MNDGMTPQSIIPYRSVLPIVSLPQQTVLSLSIYSNPKQGLFLDTSLLLNPNIKVSHPPNYFLKYFSNVTPPHCLWVTALVISVCSP